MGVQWERESEECELQERLTLIQAEQELEKLWLEAQIRAETGRLGDGLGARNFKASKPKLSAFGEQKEDMDAYRERYGQFAISQEWDENDWAVNPSEGKAYKPTPVWHYKMQTMMKSWRLLYYSSMSLLKMAFVGNSEETNWNLVKQCSFAQ